MATPKEGYRLKDGTKVPGTTTIISRFKESGGLIHWAWSLGMEGKDYRKVRDDAANIGTLVHDRVEAFVKNIEWTPPENVSEDDLKKIESGFNAYKSWQEQSKIEVIETEMQLVSEEFRFGGTPDAIGRFGDSFVLLDWKASNAVYGDYLIQLAAYGHLLREVQNMELGGFHLCRFSKEHGDFSHHYFQDLSEAWRAFVLMRELYDLDKRLKKRV